tara:strand:+ start:4556 stop:4801 length:246 start_codon:yes stop_codon:yes gene_type:complete
MTNLTKDYLHQLMERHPEGNIHDTLVELNSLLQKLDSETEPARKDALHDQIRSFAAVLEYELLEGSRSGEDYINDERFLAR